MDPGSPLGDAPGASEERQLVILAGGLGTRLAARLGGRPKPLAAVGARSVLEHQIELGAQYGFRDVVLLVHHRAEQIQEQLGDGGRFGVRIRHVLEEEPLGTGGAVLAALPQLAERFVVLYGDTIMDVDLGRIWETHARVGADATLFVHPNDHPHDSDLIEARPDGRVTAFHSHPHPEDRYLRNLVNAALYVVERSALEGWAEPPIEKQDFAQGLFPRMLEAGAHFHAYHSREYIKDMGTPDRLAKVEGDLASGLVERLAWRNACSAVFLDRDGTLNREVGHLSNANDLELLPGAGEAVRRLNRAGKLAVVVTNQPVIARGDCSEEEMARIHAKLETELGRGGAFLDGIHYCPHHPDKGFAGERPELKIECECRKPATAMVELASEALNVDRSDSWVVGDRTADLALARAAGLRAVLVRTGDAGSDRKYAVRPDYEFFDLAEAVDFVLDDFDAALDRAKEWLADCAPGEVIAVGGLGRSGKSTWASVMVEALAAKGQRARVLPLDAWLRPEAERGEGSVLDRFDVPAIEALASRLSAHARNEGTAIEIPIRGYDRRKRSPVETGEVVRLEAGDVAIVEGVPALAIEGLLRAATRRFHVECDPGRRRSRFEREYRWRGASAGEIQALWDAREQDEHPLVQRAASAADRIIGESMQ